MAVLALLIEVDEAPDEWDPDDLVTIRRGDLWVMYDGYGTDCPTFSCTDPEGVYIPDRVHDLLTSGGYERLASDG